MRCGGFGGTKGVGGADAAGWMGVGVMASGGGAPGAALGALPGVDAGAGAGTEDAGEGGAGVGNRALGMLMKGGG